MSDIIPEGILYGNLGVGSGTTNYNDLDNKPQINSVTLQGNKTASELGLVGTSDIPVTSVNGETGAVVLDGTEIEFSTGVSLNEKIIAVEQEIPVIAYPVTSVNGETGAVVLDGTDIEYSSGVSVNSQIDTLMQYTPVYGNTASGAIATFDTSLALPLQDLQIAINTSTGVGGANIQRCNNAFASLWDIDSSFKGSVEFNQLTNTISTTTRNGVTFTPNIDGSITVTGKITSGQTQSFVNISPTNSDVFVAGHKLLVMGVNTIVRAQIATSNGVLTTRNRDTIFIIPDHSNANSWLRLQVEDTSTLNTTVTPQAIDLTQMFGSTIADYIYNLEQNESGSGVTFFKSLYPNNYYAYDSGTSELVGDNLAYADWSSFGTITEGSLDVTTGKLTVTTGSMASGDYQITPIPINQLSGPNNIFCDTGDTSVVYACSLKDYIDNQ